MNRVKSVEMEMARIASARSFVLRFAALWLIGSGCQVAEKAGVIDAVPRDGLGKYSVFTQEKLRMVLTQGRIDWMILCHRARTMALSVVDTTGITAKGEL